MACGEEESAAVDFSMLAFVAVVCDASRTKLGEGASAWARFGAFGFRGKAASLVAARCCLHSDDTFPTLVALIKRLPVNDARSVANFNPTPSFR